MKKFKLKIYNKKTNGVMKSAKSDNLKYINKILFHFFIHH